MQFEKSVIVAIATTLITSSSVSAQAELGAMAAAAAMQIGIPVAQAVGQAVITNMPTIIQSAQRAGQIIQQADIPNEIRRTVQAVQKSGILAPPNRQNRANNQASPNTQGDADNQAPAAAQGNANNQEVDRLFDLLVNNNGNSNAGVNNANRLLDRLINSGRLNNNAGGNSAQATTRATLPTTGASDEVDSLQGTDSAPSQSTVPQDAAAVKNVQGAAAPPSQAPNQKSRNRRARKAAAKPQSKGYGPAPQSPAYGSNTEKTPLPQTATSKKPTYGAVASSLPQQTVTPQPAAYSATQGQTTLPQAAPSSVYSVNPEQPIPPKTSTYGTVSPKPQAYSVTSGNPTTVGNANTGSGAQSGSSGASTGQQQTVPGSTTVQPQTAPGLSTAQSHTDHAGHAHLNADAEQKVAQSAAPAFLGDIAPIQTVNPAKANIVSAAVSSSEGLQSSKKQQTIVPIGTSRVVEHHDHKDNHSTTTSKPTATGTPSDVPATESSTFSVAAMPTGAFLDPVDGSDMREKIEPVNTTPAPSRPSNPVISGGISRLSVSLFSVIFVNILFL